MEAAHNETSWLHRNPEAKNKIVGMIQAEHLGEMDYREVDGVVEATGLAEQSYLWSRNNPLLIDAAIRAIQKYGWSRAQVAVPERPGKNGGIQQVWWGVGPLGSRNTGTESKPLRRCRVWHCLDVPGFGLGGFLGHYWTTAADINRWNNDLFRGQAATMTELTGILMTSDLQQIEPL
jgi:hypothetical protein